MIISNLKVFVTHIIRIIKIFNIHNMLAIKLILFYLNIKLKKKKSILNLTIISYYKL